MSGDQRKNMGEEQLSTVLSLIFHDSALWNSICTSAWYNGERMQLLYQIIQKLALRKTEGLENQIYSYGSMIKKQDLAARQIFIWLLRMIEELPREEKA